MATANSSWRMALRRVCSNYLWRSKRALQVVSLRCQVQKEDIWQYGNTDHFSWTNVGLNDAFYRQGRSCEESTPTYRDRATLRFLLANNPCYNACLHFLSRPSSTAITCIIIINTLYWIRLTCGVRVWSDTVEGDLVIMDH
ncbi:hypothetical protein N9L68_03005 [bacterium]|nr:hypothetical protein [bacterium]